MLMTHLGARLTKATISLAIAFVVQIPGHASNIIDATYNLAVTGNGRQSLHAAGTLSNAFATVTAGGTPAPNIVAHAKDSNVFSSAGASIIYYLDYAGPDGLLPVDVAYELAYSGDFLHFGFISSTIEFMGAADVVDQIDNSTGLTAQDVKRGFSQTVFTNTVYEVILSAATQAPASNQGLTSMAMADPIISIDPSFAGDPSAYTLILSSGIGNSSAVAPEPSSLFLAGTAFLSFLTIFQIRRGRRMARRRPASDGGSAAAFN